MHGSNKKELEVSKKETKSWNKTKCYKFEKITILCISLHLLDFLPSFFLWNSFFFSFVFSQKTKIQQLKTPQSYSAYNKIQMSVIKLSKRKRYCHGNQDNLLWWYPYSCSFRCISVFNSNYRAILENNEIK